ncbi:MAG TPA: 1,4-alpha-glucan branching protein domain-containing protein [Motilibacteraceae bacterium]|nr:1,4-alpha-glucan branching protein domain-containing protein [Motilibacteraceae bacterium]
MSGSDVGTVCLVLHAHLPWLAHQSVWPVGEEWLHQAWSAAYLPLVDVVRRLAGEGRTGLLTLGVTPVLAAQLDDPYCLRQQHSWLAGWRLRAEDLASRREPHLRRLAAHEAGAAATALDDFEQHWRHGASPVLRALSDAGAIELLGGPATHPFQPLLHDDVARFALRAGLDDAAIRLGERPSGIWAPECGYRPGLEELYADAGVGHFLVDEATLAQAGRTTAAAWRVRSGDVVALARDLSVTDLVWSSRSGYPSGPLYRDFHTFDHPSGFRPARVTSPHLAPEQKEPWDPDAALHAAEADAVGFVAAVRERLRHLFRERGRPGLVVAAWDAELFGHWWHEGPHFLEQVLRLLPEAGVRVATLATAAEEHVEGAVDLGPGSWGAGKDFRVWAGEAVSDLVSENDRVQDELRALAVGWHRKDRDRARDQLAREALLALSSDWAFMVTRDSAADYARHRAKTHCDRFWSLAHALRRQDPDARRLAASFAEADGPFAHLDARTFTSTR